MSKIDWSRRHEPEVRSAIVAEHYEFAITIARSKLKKIPFLIDRDPIESAALDGLLQSIDRFIPSKGYRFRTFAAFRINGSIADALRNMDHRSRNGINVSKQLRVTADSLANQLGRTPTQDEILAASGLTAEQLKFDVRKPKSLSTDGIRHSVACRKQSDSDFIQSDSFRTFCRSIDMDGQTLLWLYYYRQATLKAIADVMGLSESRISQMHTELMKRFRKMGKERLLG
jgi:RNA polymerase sigma factor FliA